MASSSADPNAILFSMIKSCMSSANIALSIPEYTPPTPSASSSSAPPASRAVTVKRSTTPKESTLVKRVSKPVLPAISFETFTEVFADALRLSMLNKNHVGDVIESPPIITIPTKFSNMIRLSAKKSGNCQSPVVSFIDYRMVVNGLSSQGPTKFVNECEFTLPEWARRNTIIAHLADEVDNTPFLTETISNLVVSDDFWQTMSSKVSDRQAVAETEENLKKATRAVDVVLNHAASSRQFARFQLNLNTNLNLPEMTERHVEKAFTCNWLHIVKMLRNMKKDVFHVFRFEEVFAKFMAYCVKVRTGGVGKAKVPAAIASCLFSIRFFVAMMQKITAFHNDAKNLDRHDTNGECIVCEVVFKQDVFFYTVVQLARLYHRDQTKFLAFFRQ